MENESNFEKNLKRFLFPELMVWSKKMLQAVGSYFKEDRERLDKLEKRVDELEKANKQNGEQGTSKRLEADQEA